jgi:cellulose synthase operon protein YhjQ
MIERRQKPDALQEEKAQLYSRAHKESIPGYRSFSASREQVLGQFRRRIVNEAATQTGPIEPPVQREPNPPAPAPDTPLHKPPLGEASAARWYALHSVFTAQEETEPRAGLMQQPPMIAVFSLAGGVGKTCLVATLGRCLSAFREHVLLAEMAVCGLLPFYFGSRDLRPGVRIFSPPGEQGDAPVQILNLQAERLPVNGNDPLLGELKQAGRWSSRILVDMATGGREVMSRLLKVRPTILVPLLPDMSSVAGLGLLEGLLANPLYLLNQFDASSPLHLDVRAMLQQRLGDRLLPFVLHHSSAVSEALAEGMTVLDYAPGSEAAQDYRRLADWLRSYAAPVVVGNDGVRWSER